MKNKGLTITMIFIAESGNYGDSYTNISELKKLTRGNNQSYTYISRQALRYSIVEQLGWNTTPVVAQGVGDKKVLQYTPEATIKDYPEIDLFGYLKTEKDTRAHARSAVVRISNAESLETYKGDMDYLTNMGLDNPLRKNGNSKNKIENSIVINEIHKSFYSYTITIDMDRVGVDKTNEEENIELNNEEKKERIVQLLDTIAVLSRDIKGRTENLSPVFVIGGLYHRKVPYFHNRIQLIEPDKIGSYKLDTDRIKEVITLTEDTIINTNIGYLKNTFANDIEKDFEEISKKVMKINEFFDDLKGKVEVEFNGSN